MKNTLAQVQRQKELEQKNQLIIEIENEAFADQEPEFEPKPLSERQLTIALANVQQIKPSSAESSASDE